MIKSFLQFLEFEKRYSKHTIVAYENDLAQFTEHLSNHHINTQAADADFSILRSWVIFLMEQGITSRSVNRKIATLHSFFNYLQKENYRSDNPALRLKSLKTGKKLPDFLREQELDIFLDEANFPQNYTGYRDRLILELFYGTGIRLSELLNLKDEDVNLFANTLKVTGKRNKQRIIPLLPELMDLIKTYTTEKKLAFNGKDLAWFFVNSKGEQAYPVMIQRIVRKYIQRGNSSPHLLRHTYATHLLNHGADINAIKDLLGHANLAATQVYTHNSMEKLKAVFEKAHPKA